jgi:hypothetical protein
LVASDTKSSDASLAAASAASTSSSASGGSDPGPPVAVKKASTSAYSCPICLEAFKDEAYLDTCFRKSHPPSRILSNFRLVSVVKMPAIRLTPTM